MREQKMAAKAICVKLFAGCPITSEMRMHLTQSLAWQQHCTTHCNTQSSLKTQRFRDREYVGMMVEIEQPTQRELDVIKKNIYQHLRNYCPDFNPEPLPFFVFPQLLLS